MIVGVYYRFEMLFVVAVVELSLAAIIVVVGEVIIFVHFGNIAVHRLVFVIVFVYCNVLMKFDYSNKNIIFTWIRLGAKGCISLTWT